MKLDFSLDLPDALHEELTAASQERKCSPKQVCAEAVEILLAGRREVRLRPEDAFARKGPRQPIAATDEGHSDV
jgi:hypothetical protein